MSGTKQSKVTITLRNPISLFDKFAYDIIVDDTQLAKDWVSALKLTLQQNKHLEKNYCFLGFPETTRNLMYLCNELNDAVTQINTFNSTGVWQANGLQSYVIEDWYHPDSVRFPGTYPVMLRGKPDQEIGLSPKHKTLNRLHNYFEQLQGTVDQLSLYYKYADYETKYAIRQLNILCHEIESLILSQRKAKVMPEWVRPSQITTFLHADRYLLTDEHRELFVQNSYDRRFGHVYMHWTQIGKTLFEVWRDEDAPVLDSTTCEAINSLQYYSGEFDIEWGKDVVANNNCPWHDTEQQQFKEWLVRNNLDPADPKLSLGYLPIGKVDLGSFGTTDQEKIHRILAKYADIYKIEVDGVSNTYPYCWSDKQYKQMQIDMMKPGYDFSSK